MYQRLETRLRLEPLLSVVKCYVRDGGPIVVEGGEESRCKG